MVHEKIIESVLQRINLVKGILGAKPISKEDVLKLKELEAQAEGEVLMGLAKGCNEGVREVLSREHVIVALTDSTMAWPEEPTVKLVCDGLLVGEEIRNPQKLEQCKASGEMLLGTFVLYKDRLREKMGSGNLRVIIPGIPVKELEGIEGVRDLVCGSPSGPSDIYLRQFFDVEAPGIGTLLVGFNADRTQPLP